MNTSPQKERQLDTSRLCAFVVSVIMVVFIVAQGMPYFTDSEGVSTSIFSYLAMPGDYPALTTHLEGLVEGYNVNNIVGICILLQVMAIAGAILIWKFNDNVAVMAFTGATGLVGLIGYSVNSVLRLGGGTRTLYFWLFAAMLVLSVYCILVQIIPWATERKQAKASHSQVAVHNG